MQTIINEIKYWKQNHLLPQEYCDYLLALYTQGEGVTDDLPDALKDASYSKTFTIVKLLCCLILLPLSFLVIYFTQIGLLLQTGLLSTFVLLVFWIAKDLKSKNSPLFHMPAIAGFLILLLTTVSMFHHFYSHNISIYVVVMVNSLVWLFIGKRTNLHYLTASGIIGLTLMVIMLVLQVFTGYPFSK
ncbi:hypothetical protein MUN89_10850 [Halobacillus salinarum]|uniref:DUF1129 family protein n=1 Tax=Halobacillus salinarum TaxID=2932257 RepID=A0ABY4EEC6_9BACI|nr:hypothetical protein [Halobacillus salinarum]UOQ42496.1 hypothetical protein MUN89_10850 [Halobacillus salinarum]